MCGRYTLAAEIRALQKRFRFEIEGPFEFKPRFNIAPTQDLPVLVLEGPENRRVARLYRWGLIPHWASDASIGHKLINARSETAAEKPAFRGAFRGRRCLVPADGFYEWKTVDKRKLPMRVRLKGGEPFAFAGLWDGWTAPDGKELRTFTILTTGANKALAALHDRMPVILRPEDEDLWLSPSAALPDLQYLLKPFPDEPIEAYAVSPAVNKPSTDVPECIEPIAGLH